MLDFSRLSSTSGTRPPNTARGPGYSSSSRHSYTTAPYTRTSISSRVAPLSLSPPGLTNLGNTCFMNAVLQCLLRTERFVESIRRADVGAATTTSATTPMSYRSYDTPRSSAAAPSAKSRGELTAAFKTLLNDATRSYGDSYASVAPSALKSAVGRWRSSFMGYGQQDAQEFLRFLLEGIHEEVKRNKGPAVYEEMKDIDGEHPADTSQRWWAYHKRRDDSDVYDVFGGQLKSAVTCGTCGTEHLAFDPFLDLSIPVPVSRYRRFGLKDAILRFTDKEHLDGADKFHCRKCKEAKRSTKQLSVMRLPNVLVIHLKRFERGFSKVSDEVEVPASLDMRDCLDKDAHHLRENSDTRYRLYGIVNHMGSLWGGHYTALAKDAKAAEWFLFDDSRVSASHSTPPIVSQQPYVLFYVRGDGAPPAAPSRKDLHTSGTFSSHRHVMTPRHSHM
eukprot:TRINITY_DN37559_c0_g1_i1.p1 TRINITY_DN37559_c0_g1~~TRINITY_DN37559_c0_g1_i1.p1  ORF type:complete len:447 (+),score=140.69 TRINITY_DN37559_c0_g1_i1:114-1454(+)